VPLHGLYKPQQESARLRHPNARYIHQVGYSVQHAVVSEELVDEDDLGHRLVVWPGEPDIPELDDE